MKINCKRVEQAVDLIFNLSALQNYIKVTVVPLVVFLFSFLLIIYLIAKYVHECRQLVVPGRVLGAQVMWRVSRRDKENAVIFNNKGSECNILTRTWTSSKIWNRLQNILIPSLSSGLHVPPLPLLGVIGIHSNEFPLAAVAFGSCTSIFAEVFSLMFLFSKENIWIVVSE